MRLEDADEAIGFRIRQRAEQHAVQQAEHDGVRADPERQGEEDNGGQAAVAHQGGGERHGGYGGTWLLDGAGRVVVTRRPRVDGNLGGAGRLLSKAPDYLAQTFVQPPIRIG